MKAAVYQVEGFMSNETRGEDRILEIKIKSVIPRGKIYSSNGYSSCEWPDVENAFYEIEKVNVAVDDVEKMRKELINNARGLIRRLKGCDNIEILEKYFYEKWDLENW